MNDTLVYWLIASIIICAGIAIPLFILRLLELSCKSRLTIHDLKRFIVPFIVYCILFNLIIVFNLIGKESISKIDEIENQIEGKRVVAVEDHIITFENGETLEIPSYVELLDITSAGIKGLYVEVERIPREEAYFKHDLYMDASVVVVREYVEPPTVTSIITYK